MIQLLATLLPFILWADPAMADPLSIALAVASAGGWAAIVTSAIIKTVVGWGLSALGRKMMEKKGPRGPGITSDFTTQGETEPLRVILGRYATEGHFAAPPMTFQTDNDPNEWLVYVIELSDMPISGVGRIFIDNEAFDLSGNPNASLHAPEAWGVNPIGKYQDNIWVKVHHGNQSAADQYLLNYFGDYPERPWAPDMVLRGVAYMIVTFKGRTKDNIFTNGMPSIRLEVDGLPLLDPRTGQVGRTNNPMVMAYHIIRGITLATGDVYGYDIPAADIIQSKAFAAMNACDELAPDGEPRYRAGIEFKVDQEPAEVLDMLLDACGGNYGNMGGIVTLSAGAPPAPIFAFTDDDLIITSPEKFDPFPGLDRLVNAFHGSFPHPGEMWEVSDAPPLFNAEWEAEDGGRRLSVDLEFPTVPYPRQVNRLIREMAQDHRRARVHVITLPPEAGHIKLLDEISWTSVHNGYINKMFEVLQVGIDPWTECITVQIRERDPNDYDYNMADNVLPVPADNGHVVLPLTGIAGFDVDPTLITGSNGQVRAAFNLIWNGEVVADAVAWQVALRENRANIVNTNSSANVEAGFAVIDGGILSDTWYSIRAKLVFKNRPTQWSDWIDRQSLTALLGSGDIDLEVIKDEIRDQIGEVEGWFDSVGDDIRIITDEIVGIQDQVLETDFGAYSQREEIRTSLNLKIDGVAASVDERITVGIDEQMGAVSQVLDELVATVDGNTGAISQEATARANADSALALQYNSLSAVVERGENVINDQYLTTFSSAGWRRYGSGGTLTRAPSSIYVNGTAWSFNHPDDATGGMLIGASPDAIWPGVKNADGYVIEVEYILVSGSLAGAAIRLDWNGSDGERWVLKPFSEMLAGPSVNGRLNVVRGLFARPANFTGDFLSHDLYIFTNYGAGRMPKNIRIERVKVRVATQEELGQGKVLEAITASINDEAIVRAAADGALALRTESLETNFTTLDGRVDTQATQIAARYTKAQVDAAVSAGIQEFNASIRDGTRVGVANVTAALRSSVTAVDGRVTSTASSINQVSVRTNRGTASGLMRVTAESTPAGTLSRIGLRAEANAGAGDQAAALFLEARSGGLSTVGVMADRFFVASGSGPAAARISPFIIQNGVTYIDAARISNDIRSTNFVAGENGRGWRILKTGDAEFNSITIRRWLRTATGSVNIGNITPNAAYWPPSVTGRPTGADVGIHNGPGMVRTVLATPIPIAAWEGTKRTYIATAGMSGTVTRSGGSDETYWGWTADVLPLTRWTGNQSIRLKLSFWSQNVISVSNCVVRWQIYEVS